VVLRQLPRHQAQNRRAAPPRNPKCPRLTSCEPDYSPINSDRLLEAITAPARQTGHFVRADPLLAAVVGNVPFIAPDEAQFFPTGAPECFIEAYAPAPYLETVNTLALPRYAKQETMDFDKRVMIEAQQNWLPLCTRPGVLAP